jgi:hypothetical protein
MARQIEVITDMGLFTERMNDYGTVENPEPLLVQASGLIAFAESAFPNTPLGEIYAQRNDREPDGRGAHFDVYQGFIDENREWIAIFNLAGEAALKTVILSTELSKIYFDTFPEPTEVAFEARRNFSAIALATPGTEISEGELRAGTGLILPQRANGPHIVHDIVPKSKEEPGHYVKMAVPNGKKASKQRMISGKYQPLDDLVTERLGGSMTSQVSRKPILTVRERQERTRPSSSRDCNLD